VLGATRLPGRAQADRGVRADEDCAVESFFLA